MPTLCSHPFQVSSQFRTDFLTHLFLIFSTSVGKHFKDFQITHFSNSVLVYSFTSCMTWNKKSWASYLNEYTAHFLVIFNICGEPKCICCLLWTVDDKVGYILGLICTGVNATSELYSRGRQLKLSGVAALTGRGKSRKAVFHLTTNICCESSSIPHQRF